MGIPVASAGAVTEDTGVVGGTLSVSGDIDYLLGSDAGDWTPQTISGAYGSQLVIDADGNWTYTADNSNIAIQALDTGESLTEVFNVTSVNGASTVTITINGQDEPPCFVRGTLIETPHGPRPVENLRVGDMVLTQDDGPQPIRWIGEKRVAIAPGTAAEALRPVRIAQDAFGPGVPSHDLLVSPLHRILIDGADAELMFGTGQVLCAAKHLMNGGSIAPDPGPAVDYVHLLFDRHQVIRSNNCLSESFFPGSVGLQHFGQSEREELFALFPDLRCFRGGYGAAARRVLRRHEARLVACRRPPPKAAYRPPRLALS